MQRAEIGIIGGSGLYSMPGLASVREEIVQTPFGEPSDAFVLGTLEGRKVAFLGADASDSSPDAHSFLAQHPVSYPSYQTSMNGLDWLVPQGLAGLPTTIFVNSEGKLAYVHTGQYESQGTLDADIQDHALGQ